MDRVPHRLQDIDPILYFLNDDGLPTTTVVIHGANFDHFFANRPDPDEYCCLISRAQLTGRVYLLSWRSGFGTYNPVRAIGNFLSIEDNAHRLGKSLKAVISKLPWSPPKRLTLIGHSLGAHVITSALLEHEWHDTGLYDVILLGAAIGEEDYEEYTGRKFWRRCASQVRHRIINCYSGYDTQLWRRSFLRRDQLECIGRARASHLSSKIHNISFTGTLSDRWDHDYLTWFDRVMNRVYPNRTRSTAYQVEALCDCPWCEDYVMVNANEDVECPSCNITFEYRTKDDQCYWRYEPQEIECPRCEIGTIVVQAPAVEQCSRCRKGFEFDRRGSEVVYSEVAR